MATVPRLQRYYRGATTSCPHMAFGLLISPAGSAGACRGSCPPWGAPVAVQARRRTGVWIVYAGRSRSSGLALGQKQDLPGSLAIHPVTLRRSTTPDDPLRLAAGGASGAAPGHLTPKASSLHRFRGLPRRFITCCLRFTTGVAARHARLASGRRAAPLPGGSRTRWTATRGFRSCHPPLQGLPWRNKISVQDRNSVTFYAHGEPHGIGSVYSPTRKARQGSPRVNVAARRRAQLSTPSSRPFLRLPPCPCGAWSKERP